MSIGHFFHTIVRRMRRFLRHSGQFGAGSRSIPADDMAWVLELHEEGASQRAIARETGLNRHTVARIIRDHPDPKRLQRLLEHRAFSAALQQWPEEGPAFVRAALQQVAKLAAYWAALGKDQGRKDQGPEDGAPDDFPPPE